MKIITVNLSVLYLKAIDALVGEDKIFPSRSELVRVACREYLLKEMSRLKMRDVYSAECDQPPLPSNLVAVPDLNGERKIYKIITK